MGAIARPHLGMVCSAGRRHTCAPFVPLAEVRIEGIYKRLKRKNGTV